MVWDTLPEGLARGAAGAVWDNGDNNNGGGAEAEDEVLLLQSISRVDTELTPGLQLVALKWPREATTPAPEPVTQRKRGVVVDVPRLKQRQKTVEEKACVGAIIVKYVEVWT